MTTKTILEVAIPMLATFIGAFLGFVYQKVSEKKRDKKQLLGLLMCYRGLKSREDDFVKALNLIDIYFYDNKKVRTLTHDYFKHLYRPLFDTGHHEKILLDLIVAMSHDVGYKKLTHADIADFYYPQRYVDELLKTDADTAKL